MKVDMSLNDKKKNKPKHFSLRNRIGNWGSLCAFGKGMNPSVLSDPPAMGK